MSKCVEVNIHDGSLFDYHNGINCGVLITESVMRKLAKLQAEHLHEVKRVLSNESEKGNVFPSMWTLHYPDGKQTNVTFIDSSASVKDRIKYATTSNQPLHKPLVFIANTMDEAKAMADKTFKGAVK